MKLKQYQNRLQGYGITRKVVKRLWKQGIPIGSVILQARKLIEAEIKKTEDETTENVHETTTKEA